MKKLLITLVPQYLAHHINSHLTARSRLRPFKVYKPATATVTSLSSSCRLPSGLRENFVLALDNNDLRCWKVCRIKQEAFREEVRAAVKEIIEPILQLLQRRELSYLHALSHLLADTISEDHRIGNWLEQYDGYDRDEDISTVEVACINYRTFNNNRFILELRHRIKVDIGQPGEYTATVGLIAVLRPFHGVHVAVHNPELFCLIEDALRAKLSELK